MKSLSRLLIREMHKQNKILTVDKAAKPRRVIKRNSIRLIVGQGLALAGIKFKNRIYRKVA